MRVCFLNDNFYRASGITLAVQRIISSPSFQNVDVYLAGCETLSDRRTGLEDTSFVPAGKYRRFDLMQKGPGLLIALYGFAQWVRYMKFDVIHVHHRRLAVLANLLRSFTKVPTLFTCHLTFEHSAIFERLCPDTVTGVSPSVVDYLRRATRARNVKLIYNPVVFPEIIDEPDPRASARAISIGRLEPVKGYDTLIAAWAELRKQGLEVQLDVFGEGSLRASLEGKIEEYGLQRHVFLRGFAKDVSDRFCLYSFNVLASQREGFPNSVVEAAARCLPTLLTDVDGSRDAIPPGLALPNGLPYGDAEALTRALALWFGSPELVAADGKRFRECLQSRCLPARIGEQYLDAYRSI